MGRLCAPSCFILLTGPLTFLVNELIKRNRAADLCKVTISGRFNPECLIRRLYCKLGCKIIKGYEIPKPKDPKPTPPAKPPEDPKPIPPAKPPEDPKPIPPAKQPEDPKPTSPKPSEPYKQPIYVGPVYVAPICICGRPCGGACTRTESGCHSPCHEGCPCEGICRKRDKCCGSCHGCGSCDGTCGSIDNCSSTCSECRPICTKGGDQCGSSYRFFSEADSMCKPM